MASEPQPSTVHEGADNEDAPVPTNAEDRKTAAAMSNLEGRGDEDDSRNGKHVDAEALGKAMQSLSVESGADKAAEKKVKVEAVDVSLLVEQLELSKIKATELLKAHEGDAVKAMTAFVMAAV
ncbi:hypothetical protein BT63DRAFT_85926 [Microthyrium microscopicum]|uniref:Nascent polypeptide-associated complex subunit alpha-like UBA domain-containing protein n=1 Tax=Microthyrium microscopicum TaxID=703497 RepID=A0A6A6TZ86_9PEZI|nr:hypothetical protein BT63DRAFT_85926 [Microthyrium microscopicum]